MLAEWGTPVDVDTVELLVSECVANAVMHGICPNASTGQSVVVVLYEDAEHLHVEVHDPDQGEKRQIAADGRDPGALAEGGRGLHLVEALSAHWGTKHEPDGKFIYFDLDYLADEPDGCGLRRLQP
jgi:anti-sigma regulatory factor (Ser/Thr protein kinase)